MFETAGDGVGIFDANNVVGGFSGGVLVSDLGIIGLTVKAGPDGKGHEALLLAPLLAAVKDKGGVVLVETNQALAALERLFTRQLIGALDVWDFRDRAGRGQAFWVALVPKEHIGDRFTFDAITPRGRVAAEVVADGAGLSMTLAADLDGLAKGPVGLVRGTYRMEVDPAVLIPGFIVLKGKLDKQTVYFALPTGSAEMVVARGLAEAANADGPPRINDETANALRLGALPYLDGVPKPFSVVVGLECAIEFRTPAANHRQEAVGVAGSLFLPAGTRAPIKPEIQQAIEAAWKTLRFVVTEGENGGEIAGTPLPWPAGEFALTLPPADKTMRIGWPPSDKNQRRRLHNTFLFVQGLRLEYRE